MGHSQEFRGVVEGNFDYKEEWTYFIKKGEIPNNGTVRREIAESWCRSLSKEVNPFQKEEPYVLSSAELKKIRQEKCDLLAVVEPYMEKMFMYVYNTDFVVVFVDNNGFVLKVLGDPSRFCTLREGVCLLEDYMGTNGYGLVIATGKPVQVTGVEHFCQMAHHVTCSCAPVYDSEGQLMGVIGFTGIKTNAHKHTLGMAVATADAVTNDFKLRVLSSWYDELVKYDGSGIVVLDTKARILYLNSLAEKILGVTANYKGKNIENILMSKTEYDILRDFLNHKRYLPEQGAELSFGTRYSLLIRAWKGPSGRNSGFILVLKEKSHIKRFSNRVCTSHINYAAKHTFLDILGTSPSFKETVRLAQKASSSDCNVLLTGESGTGKELFAQAIHNASVRAKGPFVAINCAAIPRELLASELFGYEEGAFTGARKGGQLGKFEIAQGGTIFLDEIGEMPLDMQAVLLRVLEEKTLVRLGSSDIIPLNVRVIAATNKNLEEEVISGRFRADLYYRLNVVRITLPPLRERKEDIVFLAKEFAKRILGKEVSIEKKAQKAMLLYDWPGNIRELKNVIESILSTREGEVITFSSLPKYIQSAYENKNVPSVSVEPLKDMEVRVIKETLSLCKGNVALAARTLGVHRSTIYRKLRAANMQN